MKYIWSILLVLLSVVSYGQKKAIKWYTFEEAEALMKTHPKLILVDIYTNWCTWCKKMDRDIYSHPEVIDYINEHYYPVKFNAEQPRPVTFNGITYNVTKRKGRSFNEMTLYLTNGQVSYPTTVIFEKGLAQPYPYGGYLELYQMESLLVYYAEHYKGDKSDMNTFARNYKFRWSRE